MPDRRIQTRWSEPLGKDRDGERVRRPTASGLAGRRAGTDRAAAQPSDADPAMKAGRDLRDRPGVFLRAGSVAGIVGRSACAFIQRSSARIPGSRARAIL